MQKLAAYVFISLLVFAILELSALHILLIGDFTMRANKRTVPCLVVPSADHSVDYMEC